MNKGLILTFCKDIYFKNTLLITIFLMKNQIKWQKIYYILLKIMLYKNSVLKIDYLIYVIKIMH